MRITILLLLLFAQTCFGQATTIFGKNLKLIASGTASISAVGSVNIPYTTGVTATNSIPIICTIKYISGTVGTCSVRLRNGTVFLSSAANLAGILVGDTYIVALTNGRISTTTYNLNIITPTAATVKVDVWGYKP